MARTYNLFVSHSWSYTDAYDRLVDLLDKRSHFPFRNYSVPKDDPVHSAGSDSKLREAIRNQMIPCHVVLIMAGVYATHSRWINEEIELAQSFYTPKPIVAVRPWGNTRVSQTVRLAADTIVGWNTESIVAAIRRLG